MVELKLVSGDQILPWQYVLDWTKRVSQLCSKLRLLEADPHMPIDGAVGSFHTLRDTNCPTWTLLHSASHGLSVLPGSD